MNMYSKFMQACWSKNSQCRSMEDNSCMYISKLVNNAPDEEQVIGNLGSGHKQQAVDPAYKNMKDLEDGQALYGSSEDANICICYVVEECWAGRLYRVCGCGNKQIGPIQKRANIEANEVIIDIADINKS